MHRTEERALKRLALQNQLAAIQRQGEPELNVRRERGLRHVHQMQHRSLRRHQQAIAALEAEVDALLGKEVLTEADRSRLDDLERMQAAAKEGLARLRARH